MLKNFVFLEYNKIGKIKRKGNDMKARKFDKLTAKDIVIYVLYLLGGWQKRIHTEDIALMCYKLAPSRFSWIKYPQYPDLTSARFVLETAKKKYGGLVKGESERKKTVKSVGGWMLTDKGIQWIEENKSRIEQHLGKHWVTGDRLPAERKLRELLRSRAFIKFMDQGNQADISHAEFAESLICTVNTRKEILNDRLEQLYSIGEEFNKEEVKDYVNFCRKRFKPLLE